MDRLNKYIVSEIFEAVGYWIEIIKFEQVCKKWKEIIRNMTHKFSMQGYRSNPNLIPCNVDIEPIFHRLLEYKLYSLDLRNVKINCGPLLGLLLVHQPNLKKLNLSNTYIYLSNDFHEILKEKGTVPQSQLEELRITNSPTSYFRYDIIAKFYPNIQRLYLGNTSLSMEDFYTVIMYMKNLRLLDISYNVKVERRLGYLIPSSLHPSSLNPSPLATILFHGKDDLADSLTRSTGIQFIGKTIWDILESIRNEDEVYILESWLESGGDPDLLWRDTSTENTGMYPHSLVIGERVSDELLIKIFKVLIKWDIDKSNHQANITTVKRSTLLSQALELGHTGLSKLLLVQGFDVSPALNTDFYEMPAITLAASTGNFEIIEEFVKLNLAKMFYYKRNNCSPICAAINTGKYEMFTYLMHIGVSLYPCKYHHNIFITKLEILQNILSSSSENVFSFQFEKLYEAAQYYLSSSRLQEAALIIKYIGPEAAHKEAEIKPDYDPENI